MSSLLGYLRTVPELGGRVHLDLVPGTTAPGSPYAIVWEKPGGKSQALYGGENIFIVRPCVTLLVKPATGETPAQARLTAKRLSQKIADEALLRVDLDLDGETPYLPGSFDVTALFPPEPDPKVAGQFRATVQFDALTHRSPR